MDKLKRVTSKVTAAASKPAELWTDAPILYFHFNSANGGFASLPMRRDLKAFARPFIGVPGTIKILLHGVTSWIVPGYKCLGCAKTYFAAERDGLKHACMNNGGVISDSPSMGI